jgi:predicted GIY-YIG superfamily endonuclease
MTGTVKHARLESRAQRAQLKRGRQAHWQAIVPQQLHLGYQRWPEDNEGRWILRRSLGSVLKDGKRFYGRYQSKAIGRADDAVKADGKYILNYAQALAVVRAGISGPRDIPSRWADFIASSVTPACYLYRHYDPNGDLLYVGVSNEVMERQRRHREHSHWAAMVCHITIEPFATREEALNAEQLAIATEYPKHNVTHNGRALHRTVMAMIEPPLVEHAQCPNDLGS